MITVLYVKMVDDSFCHKYVFGPVCRPFVQVRKEVCFLLLVFDLLFWVQYIDSADLEQSTQQDEPVKYHEAWQKLCSAE